MPTATGLVETLNLSLNYPQAEAYWDALRAADLVPEDSNLPSAARLLLACLGGNTPDEGCEAVRVYSQLAALGSYHAGGGAWTWLEASDLLSDETNPTRAARICASPLSLVELLIQDGTHGFDVSRHRLSISRDLSAPLAIWQAPLPGTAFTGNWVYAPEGVNPLAVMIPEEGLQVMASTSGQVLATLGKSFRTIRPSALLGQPDSDLANLLLSTPSGTVQ